MNERPTKATTKSPSTLPSVHFQKRLIVRYRSPEYSIGPRNNPRTIALTPCQRNNALTLGRPHAISGALRGNQFCPFLLIPSQRTLDDGNRRVGWPYVLHLDAFAFELLVILKKAFQDQQAMRRQVPSLHVAAELRIVGSHGDHLVVARTGIDH